MLKRKSVTNNVSVITPYEELVRSTQACLLWDKDFNESGVSIESRIKSLVHQCKPDHVATLASYARTQMKLRTVPLVLARELARHKGLSGYPKLVSNLLMEIVQRADELATFLDIYWKEGKTPISKQVKVGLANAFSKFSEYEFGKWNKDGKVKLRDVLFLVHAKPLDVVGKTKFTKAERKETPVREDATKGELLFKKLVDKTLDTPITWETELSSGKDKKETFTRLIKEGKLGALAFLRNLRNMQQAGVSVTDVSDYAKKVKVDKVLPFQFITAVRHVPEWKNIIEPMMFRCLTNIQKIKGKTVLVVDISGSMGRKLSAKSELSRLDTALALAILAREQCEDVAIYATAGSDGKRTHATALVPDSRGFALADSIKKMNNTLGSGGIFLNQVMDFVAAKEQDADRVLVFTDEEDCDTKCNPENANAFAKRNYIINIASQSKGIAYGKFFHITSMSEHILSYMSMIES